MKKLLTLMALAGATTVAVTACNQTNWEEKYNESQKELEKAKDDLDDANNSLGKALTKERIDLMKAASNDVDTFAWVDAFNQGTDEFKAMWDLLMPNTADFTNVEVKFGMSWGALYILEMGGKVVNTEYQSYNNYYTGVIPNEILALDWVQEVSAELAAAPTTLVTRNVNMKLWSVANKRQFTFADPSTCSPLPDYTWTCTGAITFTKN